MFSSESSVWVIGTELSDEVHTPSCPMPKERSYTTASSGGELEFHVPRLTEWKKWTGANNRVWSKVREV